MPQARQDVTGRVEPVGQGFNDSRVIEALDATLRSSEATTRRVDQLAAQQKQAADRDIRMGRLPRVPGTHGSADREALAGIIDSVRDEVKAEARATVRTVMGEVREAISDEMEFARTEEQRQRRATRQAGPPVQAPSPRDSAVPAPTPAPVPAPAAPPGPPEPPRPPGVATPVTDPQNGARRTDDLAPGQPDARPPGDSPLRQGRIGLARSEQEARAGQVERTFHQKVGQRISDFGDRRMAGAPSLATNIQTERMHHVLPDGTLGAEATEQEASAFNRAARTARIFRNYGGSIAQGGSAREIAGRALPGIMGKIGVAGAAYTAGKAVYGQINNAADKVADQARSNMEFQAIQGGEGNALTNTDAMRERFTRARFAATTAWGRVTGGMNKDEATQLFNQTTELGLQGNARQNALDMATESFRRFGMSVNDSMKIITAASKSGNESLMGVGEALEQVTDAARRSGRNAKEARDGFADAFAAVAPLFTEQGAAAAVAGGVASANASLGREFQGVNLGGGLGSDEQMRMIAAQGGQQLNDIVLGEGGATGADYLRQREDFRNRRLMDQFSDPIAVEVMGRYSQMAADRKKPLTGDEAERALREIRDAGGFVPDAQMMKELLTSTGVEGATTNNALQTAFLSATGSVSESREAEAIAEESKNYEIDTDRLQFKAVADGMGGEVATSTATEEMGDIAERIGGDTGDFGAGTSFLTSGDTKARREYLKQLSKTGQGSPVVERMLKEGNEDQQYVVQAAKKGGKGTYERVVNAQDAVKFFGDQLRRGDVKIANGENEGKTLAETYGGEVDETVEVTSDDKEFAGNKKGRSRSNFERERDDKDDRGKGGEVLITPSPALERLLQFSSVGNGVTIGATTPPDPHVPGALLPSGQTGVTR